ncbi:MAG: hypothetical protein KBC15_02425 [Candidatus Levybacteria bacterium]|nr:hypothetical protein [Candidatus Levybacteria bacterium]
MDQHTIEPVATPEVAKETPPSRELSKLFAMVTDRFVHPQAGPNHEHKITVNPFVSKMASAYEKLRNAMEYREEEVILRATIERILRRRLLLGGTAKSTAEPLIRELIWARYLADNEVPESAVVKIEEVIDVYLALRLRILDKHQMRVGELNDLIYHLMSAAIEHVLNPNEEKQIMANFMYKVLLDDVEIIEETEETRNAQVYLAVRRAFAKDDHAFLQYHIFSLYFGELTKANLDHVVQNFPSGLKEINRQLVYPKRDRIFSYVKKRAAAFFVLEVLMRENKDGLKALLSDEKKVEEKAQEICNRQYRSISSKVRRAIVRSVIFILMTKVLFAFAIEGTYERLVYGGIQWTTLLINTSIPPLLMVVVSLFIRSPDQKNTNRIYAYIQALLYDESPRLGGRLQIHKNADKPNLAFNLLWLSAFVISFGAIISLLSALHFNIVSQAIFIFFVTVVSFLAYRISLSAHDFSVGDKQDLLTPFIDFLFVPVIRVGRRLTQSISQINFFLFLFDFIIETPFKLIFAFIEQWFKFLHEKTEDLG